MILLQEVPIHQQVTHPFIIIIIIDIMDPIERGTFGASKAEYMCYIVGKDVVRVDPKKIEAMKDCSHSKTLKILHGFYGFNRILCQVC
jgi:hypothetical protein